MINFSKMFKNISKAIVFLLILVIVIVFSTRMVKYQEFRTVKFRDFCSNFTNVLLNYHFTYLRPPESIDEIIDFVNSNPDYPPSDQELLVVSVLNEYRNEFRLKINRQQGSVYLYDIGLDNRDNKLLKKVLDINSLNIRNTVFNTGYDIVLSFYEHLNYCIDDLFRVYKNNDVFVNEFYNYDTLVNSEVRTPCKKYLTDSVGSGKLTAVLTINFLKNHVKIDYCETNIDGQQLVMFEKYLEKQIFKQNWKCEPDSLLIPFRYFKQ